MMIPHLQCIARVVHRLLRFTFLLGILVGLVSLDSFAAESVSFSREVQPVLARKCFACHGPDKEQRQAELRLDDRESALASQAIVPGRPEDSELVRRVQSTDPAIQMPPPDSHLTLTDSEREQLVRWIAAGAAYEPHWAFVPPVRPSPSRSDDPVSGGSGNAIDVFLNRRLSAAGLKPAPQADPYTLIRRLSLDLIGLPPTIAEADAFAADHRPDAYERLVDRLLASPHYGERWARPWLDLARYADSNGYEKDRSRSIWPYRDWVIQSLNDDMPYDEFTIEQLAGDLLPDATPQQRIATGFHRNTMLNEEGGIDPLEYRYYAMVDRVATTGTVWLGLSTGCAQCHSHKFDPISHTDYFRLMALLNNADEPDLTIPDDDRDSQRQELEAKIEALIGALEDQFPAGGGEGPFVEDSRTHLERELNTWIAGHRARFVEWTVLPVVDLKSNLPRLEVLSDGSILSSGDITKRDLFTLTFNLDQFSNPLTALRLEVLPDDRLPAGGPGRAYYEGRKGDFFLSEFTAQVDGRPLKFSSASHDYGRISVGNGKADAANVIDNDGSTGWSTSGREGKASHLVLNLDAPLAPGGLLEVSLLFERHFAASLGRFRVSATTSPGTIVASDWPLSLEPLLARDPAEWKPAEQFAVRRQFLLTTPLLTEARQPIADLQKRLPDPVTTLVLQERPADHPRPTFLHHRGEYLQPREQVSPGLPAFLLQDSVAAPRNRLDLAHWLVSDANPLAARVAVNRIWQTLYGVGLVTTSADFGTQGEPPTHPELLDWLACEFRELGWSQKELLRLIVCSDAYRRSSRIDPAALELDPENRWLARSPRPRLDAELIRDGLLQSSGLLAAHIGGPSVYPPQPESVVALAYGKEQWPASEGPDRYRRSLYTYMKRTAPFAAAAVFDAPTGEACIARRDRSNTPLQALTLLNDGMFLEYARALGARASESETDAPADRAELIFRSLLIRPPEPDELQDVLAFYERTLARLQGDPRAVSAISQGDAATVEGAAWTLVARALMNLDEVVTRP